MKASLFQKCGLALALAFAPFLGGCDAGQSASAASVNEGAQDATGQTSPDLTPTGMDDPAQDTNALSAADISADTNADAVLENASGKLISSPDSAGTNVSNNPQLTDFVKLVQAGMGESVLLAYVTNSSTAFSLSSDDILYLNDLGTPETVVSAMLQKDQQINGTSATASTTTSTAGAPITSAPPAYPNMTAEQPMTGGGGYAAAPSTGDLNAGAAVQTPPMIPSTAVEEEVQQSPNASYTYFYDSLAPYGNWVNLDGYGPCWQPTVVVANAGWTPYGDRGHWAYTDCGWCWVSDYSWGWAPFHYGRWFHNAHYGWCWAPDTVWGPAWVSWRYSDSYCGWAPLPPSACYRPGFGFTYYGRSVGFSFGFGLGAGRFTFVGMDHFRDHNPGRFRVEHREVTRIYNTTVINNQIIRGANHNLINRGVPVDRVAAATHQDIRPIRIRPEADGPRASQLGRDGRSLAVYRPELPTPRPGQAPRLVGEGVKPAPNFNLRNRVEQNQARAVSPRTPTGPTTPAVDRESRPIIGNRNVNRPDNNVARDNRFNQPGTERPGSVIMRGANQPDRPTPIREQNPGPALDRGGNNRVVTPPMTPGGPSLRNQSDRTRQNTAREINQPAVTRPDLGESQRQMLQQQRDLQQQQQREVQQQQRQLQQQQQQQQRDLQQQQRQQQRDFQQQQHEAPTRSLETPRQQAPAYQPPVRSEGTPRMMETRPAPEMRSTPPQVSIPQYSAPARSEGGGGGGNRGGGDGGGRGNGGGNGNNGNNNNGGNGRGR